jgi:hypothetical protein
MWARFRAGIFRGLPGALAMTFAAGSARSSFASARRPMAHDVQFTFVHTPRVRAEDIVPLARDLGDWPE